MDYTDRPWTNTAPDAQTFTLLQRMYGTAPATTTTTSTTTKPDSTTTSTTTKPDDDEYFLDESSSTSSGTVVSSASGNSNLHMQQGQGSDEPTSIPDTIRQRAKEAASNLEQKFADEGSNEDWVQLHRDDATAAFQIELGDGFFLQAHFLLAT
jgi:hypothetical protein